MSLTRWNPLREMEELFGGYRPLMRGEMGEGFREEWRPSVDVIEDAKEYLIKAELPEVKKEEIKIRIDGGVLTLSGERKYEHKDETEHRLERFYGSFTRSFTLPESVDQANIRAEQRDGMLYLHLPKRHPAGKKTVEIPVH